MTSVDKMILNAGHFVTRRVSRNLCAYAPPNTAVGATTFREVPSQRAATSTDSSRVVGSRRETGGMRRSEAEGRSPQATAKPPARARDTPNRSKFRVCRRHLR